MQSEFTSGPVAYMNLGGDFTIQRQAESNFMFYCGEVDKGGSQ